MASERETTEDGDCWSLQRATELPSLTLSTPTGYLEQQTWHAPFGQVHNQIDLILTPLRLKCSINKANTQFFPGAHVGGDHDLVLTTIKLRPKTKCFMKSPRIIFDLEKLKDPKIVEVLPG